MDSLENTNVTNLGLLIARLESRVEKLEEDIKYLKVAQDGLKDLLPESGVVSKSFWTRAWHIWFHVLFVQILIGMVLLLLASLFGDVSRAFRVLPSIFFP